MGRVVVMGAKEIVDENANGRLIPPVTGRSLKMQPEMSAIAAGAEVGIELPGLFLGNCVLHPATCGNKFSHIFADLLLTKASERFNTKGKSILQTVNSPMESAASGHHPWAFLVRKPRPRHLRRHRYLESQLYLVDEDPRRSSEPFLSGQL
jgi:hypothetical protein